MQTDFTLAQLADPDIAESDEDPARLRALRLLHGDLPDLCAARRRARLPARAHLSHQGHAGERQAGRRRDASPYRPLPLLPFLHDDLPVGRALHASGRPRAARISRRPTGGRSSIARCARCSRRILPYPRRFRLALLGGRLARPLALPDRRGGCARCSTLAPRCRPAPHGRWPARLPGRRPAPRSAWRCSTAACSRC